MGKLMKNMAKKKKSKKGKLNPYTEKKNSEPPVAVIEEAKIIGEVELPETKSIIAVREAPMPIQTVEQAKEIAKRYQEFLRALITEKDLVLIEGKLFGKKSAVNKICLFGGVSREPLRSFEEERIAKKDYLKWNKKTRKWYCVVKKGEEYRVAKAWVKAILPNGQYCTRGGAASEIDRKYTHDVHDLMALAETRAM